jgi:type IV pilus assembly protein PilW
MRTIHSRVREPRIHAQNGVTLIELMIALLIGLFLMGGLLTMVQNNKRTFISQNQLSQLQDSERLAMTMMTDVIQQAGYFPDPTTNTAASALPLSGSFAQGQATTGAYNAAAPGDTISVRYMTANGDGIFNCIGTSNATGGPFTFVNTFSVVVNAAGVSQLVCTRENNVQYPLVSGVQNLIILYGVNTSGGGSNVDTYMNAAQVTAATAWNNIISVRIELWFTNPLYTGPNLGQPATLKLRRDIGIMSQNGI